ncbi:hypothetical protein A3Q56_01791 [Intoshia linei]|uniref:Uncharacterized protein n=1 Tax=Intoshia linei TaxID=1819745 RepID=A0A177B7Y4_9BILA|nr:hypothetical protein A3Q56_01791 [Intoshia linei]
MDMDQDINTRYNLEMACRLHNVASITFQLNHPFIFNIKIQDENFQIIQCWNCQNDLKLTISKLSFVYRDFKESFVKICQVDCVNNKPRTLTKRYPFTCQSAGSRTIYDDIDLSVSNQSDENQNRTYITNINPSGWVRWQDWKDYDERVCKNVGIYDIGFRFNPIN